jgi:hypothetical protein
VDLHDANKADTFGSFCAHVPFKALNPTLYLKCCVLFLKESPPSCTHIHTYHVFSIRFSVDRHLGCFHFLAIVNSAAMNIGVHVSFPVSTLMNFYYTFSAAAAHRAFALLEEIFWGFNLLSWIIELSVMSNSMGQVAKGGSPNICWLCLSPGSPLICGLLGALSINRDGGKALFLEACFVDT